ncbi:hypothetical protein MCANUF31_02476 [Mycoplasmopsis canis UF31]|uniref:hypothetical protein n=1 Tax=Mycoplasmopsis canis TaxID=29555 RepID=UPI00025ADC54|nr:hypothetical protein [Mycoplasmopsis canis]EIE40122.1 hypothetical protein MCANUF31_02476 [Mycoplasmopsis canis UF31]EIE40334.1 hypothetical protein MCANUF33_02461 [Mycoplasmopsis canis UF33]WQQ12373.1 hypothetical protein RRG48_03235 [Mycoplasmopsis canis]
MKNKNELTKKQMWKLYFSFQFKSKKTYLILLSFLLLFCLVILLDFLIRNKYENYKFIDTLGTSVIVTFISSLLFLGIKIGLLNNTISKFKNNSSSYRQNKEEKLLKNLNSNEKMIYENKKKLDKEYRNSFYFKTSFPHVLNLVIWFIFFLIMIIISYS